jgi:hypothetical protein
MSKVAITGNTLGTGVFTVASPNSNVDRVLTLPDETGTVDTLQRSGNVIQVVNFQTGAVATGTTIIPSDDTIPQITEGDQYMTLDITPTAAANRLLISVAVFYARSGTNNTTLALHVGTTADALAATATLPPIADRGYQMALEHNMIAGVISTLTFKVRMGADFGGTTTFNGVGGARKYGGVVSSSITITEVTA